LVHTYDNPYPSQTLGKSFYIDFSSYDEDPGQFEIVSYAENPLVGKITYNHETVIPYGKNLMFWPVPFEMLETYEEKPQFLVEVDNMPAVCHSMKCDFTHVAAVGEVSSFTYDEGLKKLTMTGTNLPNHKDKVQSITFAGSTCTVETSHSEGILKDTETVCKMDREPTCGTWIPNLTTFTGDVATNADVKG
jgi:hypothetical protein